MKLYKFRGLQKFEYVADILCNRRFHAASFLELNDPMEGLFEYEVGTEQEYIDNIKKAKEKLNICSFSTDYENMLLWAHYADGFKGICIEVEVDENSHNSYDLDYKVKPVKYVSTRLKFTNKSRRLLHYIPEMILSRKNKIWKYEGEIRTLSRGEYIQDGILITAILFGLRTPEVLKEAIIRLAPNIPAYETKIEKSNKITKDKRVDCIDRRDDMPRRQALFDRQNS